MRERIRFLFIFAALLILIPAIAYADCTDGTGLTSHMIAGRVIAPIGTPIEAITKSGECAGHAVYDGNPIAITLWGDYDLTDGGFKEGEEIAYVATESDATGDLSYRLYPYGIGYDNMNAGNFYVPDAATVADLLMPLALDTANAAWGEVTVTDSLWTTSLTLQADVPLGAVIIELKSVPGEGGLRPTVEILTPAAKTYFSGDTLAAAFIGAGARTVTWILSGTGSGTLQIRRIRATDRDSTRLTVAVFGPLDVAIPEFVPEIAGDIDDSGTVDDADVGALFIALVTDREGSLERADVFPAGGDGVTDLLDLYYLARAVAQGRWWDGRAL
jgi:hypothetical protein